MARRPRAPQKANFIKKSLRCSVVSIVSLLAKFPLRKIKRDLYSTGRKSLAKYIRCTRWAEPDSSGRVDGPPPPLGVSYSLFTRQRVPCFDGKVNQKQEKTPSKTIYLQFRHTLKRKLVMSPSFIT